MTKPMTFDEWLSTMPAYYQKSVKRYTAECDYEYEYLRHVDDGSYPERHEIFSEIFNR